MSKQMNLLSEEQGTPLFSQPVERKPAATKQKTYTSYEMIRMRIPDGHIAENIAPLGKVPQWIIIPRPASWG